MDHRNPTHGQKVTTDPAGRNNPIREGAGPVTSDSLAAESIRQHGGFSENRDAAPLGVTSQNTTLNNTDTSAATELPPARDAESRAMAEEQVIGAKREHGNELGKDAAGHVGADTGGKEQQAQSSARGKDREPDEHQQGSGSTAEDVSEVHQQKKQKQEHTTTESSSKDDHPTAKSGESGKKHHHKSARKHDDEHQGGAAPTYVDVDVLHAGSHAKPKGKNLHEGGFDDDQDQNASATADIGSEDDPGRLAEAKAQRATAEAPGDAAGAPRQQGVQGGGQYDALSEEQA